MGVSGAQQGCHPNLEASDHAALDAALGASDSARGAAGPAAGPAAPAADRHAAAGLVADSPAVDLRCTRVR